MYEITDRTAAPYRSICYIVSEWSDGTSMRASGVVVGPNDVLTAHHVVYDIQRGYASKLTVIPGADTTPYSAPLGSWSNVTSIDTRSPNWDVDSDHLLWEFESQYDLALLGLGSRIGDTTGWLTPSAWGGSGTLTLAGYPARGTGLMVTTASVTAQTSAAVFVAQDALGPGASGGPILRTTSSGTELVGVLSAGDADLIESTYAGFFSAGNYLWLLGAIASNDTPSSLPMGYGLRQPLAGTAGTLVNDTLTGTASNDVFKGSPGTDTLDGLGGIDTLMVSGPRSSYALRHAADGAVIVTNQIGQAEGITILKNFERIAFADVTVNLTIGATATALPAADLKTLTELYVAFFNRVPEADGLAYWIGQSQAGMGITQMADAFYAAALAYPTQTGYSAGMSAGDFVQHIYRNTLGRSDGGDAEGQAYWSKALTEGTETRGSLVRTMLWAAHNFKGDATWGWVADLLDNKAAVAQQFAITDGLNYNTPQASIAATQAIAAAVVPAGTAAAVALIGVTDGFVT